MHAYMHTYIHACIPIAHRYQDTDTGRLETTWGG